MIASGSVESLGNDRSTRDLNATAGGRGDGADTMVDSQQVALGHTLPLEAAPDVGKPLPLSAVRTKSGNSTPPAPSRMPWIVAVTVLAVLVVALGAMLALRH